MRSNGTPIAGTPLAEEITAGGSREAREAAGVCLAVTVWRGWGFSSMESAVSVQEEAGHSPGWGGGSGKKEGGERYRGSRKSRRER